MKGNSGRNARVALLSWVLFCSISLFSFSSCHEPSALTTPKPLVFCDSFEVNGIDIGQQVQSFHYLNDSMLLSYNFNTNELVYFSKQGNASMYHNGLRYPVETGFMSGLFIGDDKKHYFIGRDNVLSIYSPYDPQKLVQKPMHHRFRHLKDSFGIVPSHTSPAIVKEDTLISFFAHGNFSAYTLQFSENSIAEFTLKGDTVKFIRSYIPRPKGLSEQYAPFAKYCFQNSTVHLIYPGFDTIYSYDRSHNHYYTTPIQNEDFVSPHSWDIRKVLQPDYNVYYTRYILSNFSYEAFYYNPDTRHYVVFYSPPLDTTTFTDRRPTPKDKKLMLLVLDEQFQKLKRYYVPRNDLVDCMSCFFIPGKGFAWPRFKGPDKFQKTTFYVFNL